MIYNSVTLEKYLRSNANEFVMQLLASTLYAIRVNVRIRRKYLQLERGGSLLTLHDISCLANESPVSTASLCNLSVYLHNNLYCNHTLLSVT